MTAIIPHTAYVSRKAEHEGKTSTDFRLRNPGIIRICAATGGRTFRSDINRAISSRLQPLRNWFCGWHTDSQSPAYATCFAASLAASYAPAPARQFDRRFRSAPTLSETVAPLSHGLSFLGEREDLGKPFFGIMTVTQGEHGRSLPLKVREL